MELLPGVFSNKYLWILTTYYKYWISHISKITISINIYYRLTIISLFLLKRVSKRYDLIAWTNAFSPYPIIWNGRTSNTALIVCIASYLNILISIRIALKLFLIKPVLDRFFSPLSKYIISFLIRRILVSLSWKSIDFKKYG